MSAYSPSQGASAVDWESNRSHGAAIVVLHGNKSQVVSGKPRRPPRYVFPLTVLSASILATPELTAARAAQNSRTAESNNSSSREPSPWQAACRLAPLRTARQARLRTAAVCCSNRHEQQQGGTAARPRHTGSWSLAWPAWWSCAHVRAVVTNEQQMTQQPVQR